MLRQIKKQERVVLRVRMQQDKAIKQLVGFKYSLHRRIMQAPPGAGFSGFWKLICIMILALCSWFAFCETMHPPGLFYETKMTRLAIVNV